MIRWLHISDLHLNDCNFSSARLRDELPSFLRNKRMKCDYVFCTGDIRSANVRPNSFTEDMADYMRNICHAVGVPIERLFIVPGNHDVNINNKTRKDGIFAVIEEMNHPNIHYYRNSGLYKFLDTKINFGVFSVVDDLNPFPTNFEKNENEIYIALYHGSINGCIAENKFVLESNTKSEIFDNYDIVMLGDIHRQQTISSRYEEKIINESDLERYKASGWNFIEYIK